jgi:hypothetical protein
MKNKPDPTVLKTSFLSIESVKRTPKSHETISLLRVLIYFVLEELGIESVLKTLTPLAVLFLKFNLLMLSNSKA